MAQSLSTAISVDRYKNNLQASKCNTIVNETKIDQLQNLSDNISASIGSQPPEQTEEKTIFVAGPVASRAATMQYMQDSLFEDITKTVNSHLRKS